MADLIDAESTILSSLRSNITDPMSRGVHWIHQGATRARERTPNIRIQRADDFPEFKAVGSTDQFSYTQYRIIVQVGLADKVTISGTVYNDVKLLNYISGLVIDHLKSVGKTIGGTIINIVRESAGGYVFDETTRRHVNVLMYRVFTVN